MNRSSRRKKTLVLLGLILAIILGIAGYAGYSSGIIIRFDRSHTLHSPVFSPDGKNLYYLERRASGFSFGPGWEFFTPPATVYIMSDRFTLMSMELASGERYPLTIWDVPHDPRTKENYRNRLFGIPRTELSWNSNALQYLVGLNVKKDANPTYAETEWATGTWNPLTGTLAEDLRWQTTYLTANSWPDQIIYGNFEAIDYKNIAILLNDISDSSYRILVRSDTSPLNSEELLAADLAEYSHRADIERILNLKATHERLYQGFKQQGLSEGQALLRTSDELERQGLIPKGPKITASEISTAIANLPVFEISDQEFLVGLFQDIQKAIEAPGTEIDYWGNYVRHRDFTTSERLNEWLEAGNLEFQVRTEKALYHMVITR